MVNWEIFAPAQKRLNITELDCRITGSGNAVVEAFFDNPTPRRMVIPLQTEPGGRIVTVWADRKLIEGGTLESSAGQNVPYLALPPGGTGWIRLKAEFATAGEKPNECSLTFQGDRGNKSSNWKY